MGLNRNLFMSNSNSKGISFDLTVGKRILSKTAWYGYHREYMGGLSPTRFSYNKRILTIDELYYNTSIKKILINANEGAEYMPTEAVMYIKGKAYQMRRKSRAQIMSTDVISNPFIVGEAINIKWIFE